MACQILPLWSPHGPSLVRSALRWADTILESLGDVIPGGGAAQEFKQSAENTLGRRTTNRCP